MSDRDRLAADLETAVALTPAPHINTDIADRLIAFGWTRLDEGRLARALRKAIPIPETYEEWQRRVDASYEADAAVIAKAYREGADAVPEVR